MARSDQNLTPRPGPDWERERKFLTPLPAVREVLDAIRPKTAPEVHDPARPVTWNRTTYLDTDDFSYLRSARSGGMARKLRVREYASAPDERTRPRLSGACFLELKECGGGFRTKTRAAAEPARIARMLAGEVPGGDLTGALGVLGQVLRAERPRPRLTTWYRRVTHTTPDQSVRITIDFHLVFSEPAPLGGDPSNPMPVHPVASVPFAIVEVKSALEWPAWLEAAVAPLHEARDFSKFEQGMTALYPFALSLGADSGAEASP